MKKVTVVINQAKDVLLEVSKKVITELAKYAQVIYVDKEYSYNAPECVKFVDSSLLFEDTDVVITIGGDGTILKIAPEIAKRGICVLGINLGRVGFMAELEPDEIGLLSSLFSGEYIIENRMMLDVDIFKKGDKVSTHTALNDVVVMNGSISRMIEIELLCNETHVSTYHADGLILSTPTGSTAYSLSAGGAVIDPFIECILATPVCAHSFHNSRPIVFSPSSELCVVNKSTRDDNTYVTLDGNRNIQISYDEYVRIKKSQFTTNLIKIKSNRFYNTLYNKLSERR